MYPITFRTIAITIAVLVLTTPSYSLPVNHIPRADPVAPSPKKAAPKKPNYDFEILNPSPNDIWVSGSNGYFSWIDHDLPWKATFDFTLVPVDPKTNPKAITITRRPFLKYVSAMDRTLDFVVPYNLVTKDQLLQIQDGLLIQKTDVDSIYDKEHLGVPSGLAGPNTVNNVTTTHEDIRSLARLYITAYEGKTNKILVRKSIFPIVIVKDNERDKRPILPPLPELEDTANQNIEQSDDESEEDILEKKDSDITHHEDHIDGHNTDETNDDNHHEDKTDNEDMEDETKEEDMEDDPINVGLIFDDNEHKHEHGDGEGTEENEEMEHHNHSHSIDPDHFQNEEDIEIWKEHRNDPGYNPPIKVTDAGTFNITRWIAKKDRFFVGSPYVFAWDFPESGLGLTGTVNVYVEDAYTDQRYDIVAGNLPSSIQFMYLHPTAVMVSADPTKRIFLRARVELDLFKGGNIERYTAFSKMFYVEHGAL
ncbi:hypothetical protein BGZ76_002997 [Entomortierella beljakovae]|nr:hypothetical protein BGZ76_002997 [Entomortierella beljakovae]